MTLNEKADAIKYLKTIVVKRRKYEFAAWLRDREKEILSQLNLSYKSDYNYFESISYSQYLHLIEIIEDFESGKGYNHSTGYSGESEIKEYLYKSCINVIREEKLDRLFGDES